MHDILVFYLFFFFLKKKENCTSLYVVALMDNTGWATFEIRNTHLG